MRKSAFTLIELLVVVAIISILAAILFPVFSSARARARQTTCTNNLKQIGMGLMQYIQDYDETMPWSYYGPATPTNPAIAPSDATTYYKWMDAIYPYVKSEQVFDCPDDLFSPPYHYRSGYNYGSYGQNGAYKTADASPLPTQFWLKPPRSGPDYVVTLAMIASPAKVVWATDTNNSAIIASGGKTNGNIGIQWTDYTMNPTILTFGSTRELNQISERHIGTTNVLYCDAHVKSLKLENLAATTMVADPQQGNSPEPIMTAFTIEDN